MWTDKHSERRGHKLMGKGLGIMLPPLRTYENVGSFESIPVPLKLFSPYSGWTWYIYEWDEETGLAFGLVEGFETEFGYIDLTELSETMVMGGLLPAVERDLHWRTIDLATVSDMVGLGLAR